MENAFDTMRDAFYEARQTMAAADQQANAMADILLDGQRLRVLSSYRLQRMKRELQNFNSHTRKWTK